MNRSHGRAQLIALTILILPTSPPAAQVHGVCANKPERLIATKRTSGRFDRFEVGDYIHVRIEDPRGETASYWAPLFETGEPIVHFLVAHPKKTIALEYDVLDSCIPEAGGYQRIERLKSAAIDGLTAQAWWQNLQSDPAAVKRIQQETRRWLTGQDGPPRVEQASREKVRAWIEKAPLDDGNPGFLPPRKEPIPVLTTWDNWIEEGRALARVEDALTEWLTELLAAHEPTAEGFPTGDEELVVRNSRKLEAVLKELELTAWRWPR